MTILYDFGMLMLLSLIVIIFIIIVIVTNICVIVYQQQWFLISYLATSLYKLSNQINICYIYPAKWVYFPTYILILQRKFEPLDSRLQIRASRGAPPTALQWIRPHKRFVRSSDSPSQVTQSSNPVTFTNPNEPKSSIIVSSGQFYKYLFLKNLTWQISEHPPPLMSRAWWRGQIRGRWWSGCSLSWPSRPPCRHRTSLSGCCTGCSQRMASRLDIIMTGLYTAL